MHDVFISYSHHDRPWAKAFAEVLEARGWTVWWDRDIAGGGKFRQVITKALDDARCVVVLWSPQSKDSEFVWNEVERARKKEILVPVMIEQTELPLGFGERQTLSLLGWEPGSVTDDLEVVIASIAQVLNRPAPPPEPYPARFWINLSLFVAASALTALWLWLEIKPLIDGRLFLLTAIAAAVMFAVTLFFVLTRKHSRRPSWALGTVLAAVAIGHFLTPQPLQLIRVEPGRNLFRLMRNPEDLVVTVSRDGKLLTRRPYTKFQTVYLGRGGDDTQAEIRRRNGDEEHKRQLRDYMHKLDPNVDEERVAAQTDVWVNQTEFWETPPLRRTDQVKIELQSANGTLLYAKDVQRNAGDVIPTVFIERP